jgi:ectoine hydroxylase-related dioxygenase (phytanoyl-CoA dioxygenase family)
MDWAEAVEQDGYAIVPDVLTMDEVEQLRAEFEGEDAAGVRNILNRPAVRDLASSAAVRALVDSVLGANARPVRGLYFDKLPDANWKVPWHQDATIAVQERAEVNGFSTWSMKAGVHHVRPPAWVLEGMLAVRLHLDDCGPDNGPLRVLPGTHLAGKLGADAKSLLDYSTEVMCTVGCGGAILMRPLLMHASSQARNPAHRRVIHIEFAAVELPPPLQWL